MSDMTCVMRSVFVELGTRWNNEQQRNPKHLREARRREGRQAIQGRLGGVPVDGTREQPLQANAAEDSRGLDDWRRIKPLLYGR